MKYELFIGAIRFCIDSERELVVEDPLVPFLANAPWKNTVHVRVSWDFSRAPKIWSSPLGADSVQAYYRQEETRICALPEGHKGFLSLTVCDDTCQNLKCYINEAPFRMPQNSLSKCLRMLPMRAILQRSGVAFFHAAQIALGDTGILFTASSGTGKTTQAKLWQQHRGARLICNDRTLVRDGLTYGFPVDGSEPVFSSEVNRIGAVVILGQGKDNRVARPRPGAALAALMPQLVIDTWDEVARELAMAQLLDLVAEVPVYRLDCTPDLRAVACLEQRLITDGVLS